MISLNVGSKVRINKTLNYILRKEPWGLFYLEHPDGLTRLSYKPIASLKLEDFISYLHNLHCGSNITSVEIDIMGKWITVYKKKIAKIKKLKKNITQKVRTVSIGQLVNEIRNTNGKFFHVTFRKRSDGTLREMNARTDVKKYLKGGKSAYKPNDYGLINVFDNDAKDYRTIPIEGLISAKIGGIFYKVKGRS